jgi:hypothetical protein
MEQYGAIESSSKAIKEGYFTMFHGRIKRRSRLNLAPYGKRFSGLA